MSNSSGVIAILRQFPGVDPQQLVCLGNAGGFSGACLWRVTTPQGLLCLRKWPRAYPSEPGLRRIHQLLGHAKQSGLTQIPAPLRHRNHDTVLKRHNSLYELTPWMPGRADFHAHPNRKRLIATMTVLAQFHAVSRTCPGNQDQSSAMVSPGLRERRARLQRLLDGEFDRLAAAVAQHAATGNSIAGNSSLGHRARNSATLGNDNVAFHDRAQQLLDLFPRPARAVLARLDHATARRVPLQPCIRDIWHDHVLFTGDDVSGVIDFGAIRDDHVGCDLARLIGSLVGDNQSDWSAAIDAYTAHQPLTEDEQVLIRAFDHSSVLMSGLSWLQWICVEGRRFDDPGRVLSRLDENLSRLQNLATMG